MTTLAASLALSAVTFTYSNLAATIGSLVFASGLMLSIPLGGNLRHEIGIVLSAVCLLFVFPYRTAFKHRSEQCLWTTGHQGEFG
ncbi:hypothetical protein P6U16_22115 (plasmid) [Rhizobium sp. 32-5/1]|uniref:hypothetical protein n=1 Tax=Rhizobium sp. 32-5/1 TaxID=3019602 RepID=UPI00240E5895|nr:hypothetical protein [Rhizobium sp. 32-5/1]WEZ85747.1 hypothetical protein P6U16_22115 [Rhizobium sp. 32-5/1]